MILYIWVKSKAFKQCLFCFWFCPPETIVHQKNACLPLNSHHSRLNGFVENQLHLPIICCRDSLGQQRVIRVLEMRIMISGPAPRSTVCILIMQRPKISTTYFLQQCSPNSEPGNVWLHISTSNTLCYFFHVYWVQCCTFFSECSRKTFSKSGRKKITRTMIQIMRRKVIIDQMETWGGSWLLL